jgi:hypothetical protein
MLSLAAASAHAAETTVDVSSLAVVVGGKASGTVSGFAPSAAVTVEGQAFTADGNGTVTLLAAQLTSDSELSVSFVDADGTPQTVDAPLRNLLNGTTLTASQLFDLVPDATQPTSRTVGQPSGTGGGGSGNGGAGGGSGGGGAGGGGGSGGGPGTTSPAPTTPGAEGVLPPGAVRLAGGAISIPSTSVALPNKLVVTRVVFSPTLVRSRTRPITTRITISDNRGYLVRDALVYLRGVPERRIVPVVERRTTGDGTVSFTLRGTKLLPLRKGGRLTIFVRARTGTSAPTAEVRSRLVSLRLSTPARR